MWWLGQTRLLVTCLVWVLVAMGGCGSAEQAGLEAYATCMRDDSTRSCAVGACDYDPYMGFTCQLDCEADADCPARADGTPTICGDGTCRPIACVGSPAIEGLACVDGTLQRCEALANPPCSRCPVCGEGEYCSEEMCWPVKEPGQPCDNKLSQCPQSSSCNQLALTNGEVLYGGQTFCSLPVGSPCWPGDPCFCSDGACTYACESDEDCKDGTECVAKGSGDFQPTCRRRCDSANPGACDAHAICGDISLATSVGEVNVCMADGERPPRPQGFPCQAPVECTSGVCCPATDGDAWGRCAGDRGC